MHEHDNSHTSLHASADSMLVQENPNSFVTKAAAGPNAPAVNYAWPGKVILLLMLFMMYNCRMCGLYAPTNVLY